MNDAAFRWKDPRDRRIWEVGACSLEPIDGTRRQVLCFDSRGTPRSGHAARCCPAVAMLLESLNDQELALCLDAAVHGDHLWIDPRDGVLWRVCDHEENGSLCFIGSAEELDVGVPPSLMVVRPDEFIGLRDQAVPRTAA